MQTRTDPKLTGQSLSLVCRASGYDQRDTTQAFGGSEKSLSLNPTTAFRPNFLIAVGAGHTAIKEMTSHRQVTFHIWSLQKVRHIKDTKVNERKKKKQMERDNLESNVMPKPVP